MKTKIFLAFCLFILPFYTYGNTYIEKEIRWHTIKVIKYNLEDQKYKIKIVKSDSGDNLSNLVTENNWITWINWVFFCPADYRDCKWKENTTNNERYFDGKKYNYWPDTWERVVYGWDKDMIPLLFQSNKINEDIEWNIWNWFSNWPLLLKDWKNQLEHYWEVNMIDAKMRASTTRNFICNDKEKKNIYFWLVYNAVLDDVPVILSDLWCSDALNLDAGASTAFIYNWKYLVWPQRNIIDAVVIERKWIDVKSLIDQYKKTVIQIKNKISKYNNKRKIKEIEKQIKTLKDVKTYLYNKYSSDIVDKDDNWDEHITWYQIKIDDTTVLKKIYLINWLLWEFNKYLNTLKKNIDADDDQK
jgi:hypothetical protein